MKDLGDHFKATESGPNYDHKVDALVAELGPATIVNDLTPAQLRAWFNRQPRADSTRNHYLEFLSMMINTGLRDGVIQFNPLAGGIKQQLQVKVQSTEAEILTVDQVDQVMTASLARPEACHVLALMLFGGLEIEQACSLCYDDITSHIRVAGYLTPGIQAWSLYCPANLPVWLGSDGPKTGRITHLGGNSMGRVHKKIFWKLGIPRPDSINYTWAAYRRAIVGNIEQVYAGRYLTGTKTKESRVPVVSRAEGERYFSLVPPTAAGSSAASLTLLPPPDPEPGKM